MANWWKILQVRKLFDTPVFHFFLHADNWSRSLTPDNMLAHWLYCTLYLVNAVNIICILFSIHFLSLCEKVKETCLFWGRIFQSIFFSFSVSVTAREPALMWDSDTWSMESITLIFLLLQECLLKELGLRTEWWPGLMAEVKECAPSPWKMDKSQTKLPLYWVLRVGLEWT